MHHTQDDGALEDLEEHELDRAVAARSDDLRKPRGGKAAKYDDDEEVEEEEEPVNLGDAFVGDSGHQRLLSGTVRYRRR